MSLEKVSPATFFFCRNPKPSSSSCVLLNSNNQGMHVDLREKGEEMEELHVSSRQGHIGSLAFADFIAGQKLALL